MYRAHYSVDSPSDYWKISIYIGLLDHLVEEMSKRVVSNEESIFLILSKRYKSSKPNI